jgi:hypothetical protein
VVFHNGAPAPDMPQLNSCTAPLLASGEPLPAPYTVGDGLQVDLGGNELRNAPATNINLGAKYNWNLNRYRLSARVDYYWQDEMWGREFNRDPIDRLDDFDVWNAQATVAPVRARACSPMCSRLSPACTASPWATASRAWDRSACSRQVSWALPDAGLYPATAPDNCFYPPAGHSHQPCRYPAEN